ncbi:hypothetical protein [Bacillus altitudinis]|uniref:hypothetical protein n=1 Tax=Bacillus altitudinis TaxID=293387 RepID=UPI0024AD25D8|nr:hypothetical protein [Bacillus altitudinis]MDI4570442.1 hypothetical protein [Bacillus altitudinis]
MALSKWTDNTDKSMDDILQHIMSYKDWFKAENDPETGEPLGFQVHKVFDENKQIKLNNQDIIFNLLNFDYERLRPGEEKNPMRSTRIFSITGNVIIYTDKIKTQYIINRSNSPNTLTMLRKLNDYKGRRNIIESPFSINDDMFIWMINKVLNEQNKSLDEEENLSLDRIIGFKGSTADSLAVVKGSGNRILNILSTLAFLFENENVSNIKPRIQYENETVEVSLDLNGSIDVDLETYTGNYIMHEDNERYANVILMVLLEIIPKLLTIYNLELQSEEWSFNKKKTFFESIGTNISDKINEKIEAMEKNKD